jgi:hypothetical protein
MCAILIRSVQRAVMAREEEQKEIEVEDEIVGWGRRKSARII